MNILRYMSETGASSPTPKDGYLPVFEGNPPQPTQCEKVMQDKVEPCEGGYVQTYKLLPAAKYTAGEWLELVGFGTSQQPTLIYMKLQLQAAGKTSAKLTATEQYLNGLLALFATNPTPRSDWEQPPYRFHEVVGEVLTVLHL
jgi:hypothetical protein